MMLSQSNLQRLQEVPIFREIEQQKLLSQIAANLEEVELAAGHTIFKQGETGSLLYIVVSGTIQVHIGGLQLAKLGPGDYFGEMSLFDPEPHSASVTTLEVSKCLVLTQQLIYQVIKSSPEMGLNVIRILCQRVRKLNLHISAWLRGLLTVAWADNEYSQEEKDLIQGLIKDDIGSNMNIGALKPISAPELASALAGDTPVAENFLRTAVIVALANGTYSEAEDRVLREFCTALGQTEEILDALRLILIANDIEKQKQHKDLIQTLKSKFPHGDLLHPVRQWLDEMDINTPYTAKFLCKMIPAQCPFERDIILFGHKVVHIPPMCKINPLYEQLVGLRFRALSYLADRCGEDISSYI